MPIRAGTQILAILGLSSSLSGCAVTYTDAVGSTHVLGFADIKIQAQDHVRTKGADILSVETLGLSFLNTGEGTGVALGYDAYEITVVYNNACVSLQK